jgi:hypothetical protein
MTYEFYTLNITVLYDNTVRTKSETPYSNTDMRRLTTGIRSQKCIVRRFRRWAKVYLHKPR